MRSMPVLEIIRLEEDDSGTFGILKINKQVFCCTLEPADRLNRTSVSSIPAQQYYCMKHDSPKYGKTFKVQDVPDRSSILFHPGNKVGHTEGCVLLGQYFGKLKGDRVTLNSGATFREFMNYFVSDAIFHLTIKEIY